MIIKGRSPMMRHVSRTHRVALDGLFDRINLEPQDPNQTCWHQKPARRLVNQRKFHAWWWCNLLRLFNLMNSSMFSHSRFRSIEKANTMSKRIHERKTGEEPAVAKPRSTCLMSRNLLNEKQLSSLGSDAAGFRVCVGRHQGTGAKQRSKPSNVSSREEWRQSAAARWCVWEFRRLREIAAWCW